MACYDTVNQIRTCGTGDAFWKGYTNGKFPQDTSKYNSHQTNVIGGINNSKNVRISSSSFTLLKNLLLLFNLLKIIYLQILMLELLIPLILTLGDQVMLLLPFLLLHIPRLDIKDVLYLKHIIPVLMLNIIVMKDIWHEKEDSI